MNDWYNYTEETPTCELRWNTFESRPSPVLEQRWKVRIGRIITYEWRKVPFVETSAHQEGERHD